MDHLGKLIVKNHPLLPEILIELGVLHLIWQLYPEGSLRQ